MKREPGYYWIRLSEFARRWQPAEYCESGCWLLIGSDNYYEEYEIKEIREVQIKHYED
jgi:hypothetical protein